MSVPPPIEFSCAPLAELALCLIARPLCTREIHWRMVEIGLPWDSERTASYLHHLCKLHLIAPATPSLIERTLARSAAFLRYRSNECDGRLDLVPGLDRYVVTIPLPRSGGDEWSLTG